MARLFTAGGSPECRLLDAGAGIGSLSSAFLERCASGELTFEQIAVTAFPNRALMARYLSEIAWETEVWVADAPSHLIHFNGERFLGPYAS